MNRHLEEKSLSESEEMYLATIARLQEASQPGPVPLSKLAEQMAVLPVSINQMVRKLEEAGLVTYLPYKGAELTPAGEHEAGRILRHRRLWEVFLVERLHYAQDEAGSLACRLEHTLPPEAAERLAAFLGNPLQSPSGAPIPPAQGDLLAQRDFLATLDRALSELNPSQAVLVVGIPADGAARKFLEIQGIQPGARLKVLASATHGELLVQSEAGESVLLSAKFAQSIRVIPVELP